MSKKQKIAIFLGICAAAGIYLYFDSKKKQEHPRIYTEEEIIQATKAGEGKG